jgi:hypothetical protein
MLNTQIIKFIPPAVNKRNLVYDGEAQPVSHTKFEFKNSDQIRLPVLPWKMRKCLTELHRNSKNIRRPVNISSAQ